MAIIQSRYLIIDCGSHSIKGLLYESGPVGERILSMEKLPSLKLETEKELASASDLEEEISPEEREKQRLWNEYEYNLMRLVHSFFAEESNYVLQLPLSKLHVRDFTFPIVKTKELGQAISFQAEESLPYSLEKTEVVGHSWAADEQDMHILAFGAERELVENTVKPLSKEHSVITALFPNSSMLAGLVRLFKASFYEGLSLGQLDIGASSSTLNILDNGKLSFTRSLAYGGNDLTEIVASVLGLTKEKAESKKLALDLDFIDLRPRSDDFYEKHSITKSKYDEIIYKSRSMIEKLCLEIERSFLALGCPTPESIYLSGGASLSKGLSTFMKENLQRNVDYYPLSLSDEKTREIWATALGAMEQQKLPLSDKDNFLDTPSGSALKGKQFHLGVFRMPLAFSIAALLVFSFSIALGIFHDRSRVKKYREEIQAFAQKIPGILSNSNPEQILVQAQSICRQRMRNMARSRTRILDLLQEINHRSPSPAEMDIVFRKLRFDSKSLQFEVELANVGESANLQQKLGESHFFKNVEIKRRRILPNQRARVIYSLENAEKKESFSSNTNCS